MLKEFSSFSPCGTNFFHCGLDGKLKIWDTSTGVLKQEFVPNLHLTRPCSSYAWLNVSKYNAPSWKTKKRKGGSRALALGCHNGSVAVYSLAEGKVVSTLQAGIGSAVVALVWSDTQGLVSVTSNQVFIWDIESKVVKCKWKCGKGKITSVGVSDATGQCVTASNNLKIWDIQTKSLIRTLCGHSSDVTNVQFIDSQYFMTTASGERHISVWSVTHDREVPVVRFALRDSAMGQLTFKEIQGQLYLTAITASGVLHLFTYQFNGKVNKSVKAVYTVEVANSEKSIKNGGNVGTPSSSSVSLISIVACHIQSAMKATIAYGVSPAFIFENIELKQTKETVCLVRAPSLKPVVHSFSQAGEEVSVDDVEYISGVGSSETTGANLGGDSSCSTDKPMKRDRGGEPSDVVEVPLEMRVSNLSASDGDLSNRNSSCALPLQGMTQLLIQALESKDRNMLETVLMRKDETTIRQTVSRLPPRLLSTLLKFLTQMIQQKAMVSLIAVQWLRSVLLIHSSQLLADNESLTVLSQAHAVSETRLSLLPRLISLSGRLSLLVQNTVGQDSRVSGGVIGSSAGASSSVVEQPALVVYNDDESSDEGSSIGGVDKNEISESEDKWDELTDEDLSNDNMSS